MRKEPGNEILTSNKHEIVIVGAMITGCITIRTNNYSNVQLCN